jgi:hypothetical protein
VDESVFETRGDFGPLVIWRHVSGDDLIENLGVATADMKGFSEGYGLFDTGFRAEFLGKFAQPRPGD